MAGEAFNVKKVVGLIIFIALLVLSYLLLRQFMAAIISAAVFSYVIYPLFKKLKKLIRNPHITSAIICISIIVILFFLFFFLTQTIIKEITSFSSYYESKNVSNSIQSFILKISNDEDLSIGIGGIIDKGVEKLSSSSLEETKKVILNLPLLLLQFFIFFLLLFFSLTNMDKIKEFLINIMPFKEKAKEKFLGRFKDVTNGVIYGIFAVGIIQGISTGIGLLIFGVPQVLLLTIASIIAVIVPYVGSAIIWIPVAISLMINVSVTKGVLLLIYGIIVMGFVENLVRPYIVSKKTKINFALIFLGMIGGFELFGLIGVIIGPLIIDYFLLFIEFYREKHLEELF